MTKFFNKINVYVLSIIVAYSLVVMAFVKATKKSFLVLFLATILLIFSALIYFLGEDDKFGIKNLVAFLFAISSLVFALSSFKGLSKKTK